MFPICCCWRWTRRQAADEAHAVNAFCKEAMMATGTVKWFNPTKGHLTLVKRAQAGTLDRGDMNEHISAAVLWLNEPIACLHEPDRGRTTIAQPPIRSQRCLWEGTPRGARQNKAKIEYRDCTRFSQGVQPREAIEIKVELPWTIARIGHTVTHHRP